MANCATVLDYLLDDLAIAKIKFSFTLHLDATCNKKNDESQVSEIGFPKIPWHRTRSSAIQEKLDADSLLSQLRWLNYLTSFPDISLGRRFSYIQLKERLFIETWKERRIEAKTSLTTAHFGDSVWRLSGMGRHFGRRRCFGLTASYPATPQTHPKCPSSFPCFSLSSISHQVLPNMNSHQARNLRRLDLFSRLSQHNFQAQPAPRGHWTTWTTCKPTVPI